jgi:hypothetical protein
MANKRKFNITVNISDAVKKKLEKRAKRELLSLEQLISEILRRSVLSYKGSSSSDNVDDKFITFFSRKSNGKNKKQAPKPEYSDSEFNPENLR